MRLSTTSPHSRRVYVFAMVTSPAAPAAGRAVCAAHNAYLQRYALPHAVLCWFGPDLAEHLTKILAEWWYSFAAAGERDMFPKVTRKRKCCPRPTGPLTKHHCGRHTLPLRRTALPAQDLRAPGRKHHYCLRQALPLRGSVAPAKSHS